MNGGLPKPIKHPGFKNLTFEYKKKTVSKKVLKQVQEAYRKRCEYARELAEKYRMWG